MDYNPLDSKPECPKTWMVESVLATIFCGRASAQWVVSDPGNLAQGIINASKVSSLYASGRYDEAQQASKDAGKWTKIAAGVGIVGGILYLLFLLIFGFSGMADQL